MLASRLLNSPCARLATPIAAAAVLMLTTAGQASALPANCIQRESTVTCTFVYTGGEQHFTVPTTVTRMQVEAVGGRGGDAELAPEQSGGRGGLGGTASAPINVFGGDDPISSNHASAGGGGGGGSSYAPGGVTGISAEGMPPSVTISYQVPVVGVRLTPLNFATQAQDTLSAPQTLTVTNEGEGPLVLSALTFTGADPGDFLIGSDGCLGQLEPSESCDITVSFAPQAQGERAAAPKAQPPECWAGPVRPSSRWWRGPYVAQTLRSCRYRC
jgi:hypothetical protein